MKIEDLPERYVEFDKVNLYCFDILQYQRQPNNLTFILFANYEGKTYCSTLLLDTPSNCSWNGKYWELRPYSHHLAYLGLEDILEHIFDGKRLFTYNYFE